jgi:hypothetical protein
MMQKTLPILLTLPLLAGCGSKQSAESESIPRTTIVDLSSNHSALPDTPEELYYALADSVRETIAESFLPNLTSYLENNQWNTSLKDVQNQIVANPNILPFLPGFNYEMVHRSIYDGAKLSYRIVSPTENPAFVIIYLGDADPSQLEIQRDDCCVITIPSRAKLDYQLVAEGDFWNSLQEINTLLPRLTTRRTVLVSSTESADSALYFLDRYPGKFLGAAIGGSPKGIDFKNLDKASIVRYGAANTHGLIFDLLESHGNRMVTERFASLGEAIVQLEKNPPEVIENQFIDYQYNSPAPWFKIIAKRSEIEPTQVMIEQKGRSALVRGPNIASAMLIPPFPEKLEVIEFEGNRIPINGIKQPTVIGESINCDEWALKSESPSGLMNFFRNEPVIVVYYNGLGVPGYLEKVKMMAESISTLQFKGLPKTDVKLPLVPLSEYEANKAGKHRLIYIGNELAAKSILEKNSGYWPVEASKNGIVIKGVEIGVNGSKNSNKSQRQAYSLFYPPEEQPNIVLALCLVGEDERAIDLLKEQFTSSTAFFRNEDVMIWTSESGIDGAGDYNFSWSGVFDSYWGYSDIPSFSIPVPQETARVWQAMLQDMMIEESQTENSILSPLINPYTSPPGELTYSSLEKFIPDRSFAIVTLRGSATSAIGDKLMGATMNMQVRGFGAFISRKEGKVARFDPTSLQKGKVRFLVETSALRSLNTEELALIEYEFVPQSLHEMVLKRAKRRGEQFGKDLIRISNEINSPKER